MTNRTALEEKRKPAEMGALLERFDEKFQRNKEWAKRKGIRKDIEEEYRQLYYFVRCRPKIKLVWLESIGNGGSDAGFETEDGRIYSVQITLADAGRQAYYNRKISLQNRPYFPIQTKRINSRTDEIETWGRALESPTGRVKSRTQALSDALERKRKDFSRTDVLLVVFETPVLPKKLLPAVKRESQKAWCVTSHSLQFREIYILHGRNCQRLK